MQFCNHNGFSPRNHVLWCSQFESGWASLSWDLFGVAGWALLVAGAGKRVDCTRKACNLSTKKKTANLFCLYIYLISLSQMRVALTKLQLIWEIQSKYPPSVVLTAQRLVCFLSLSASLSSKPADIKQLALQARLACFWIWHPSTAACNWLPSDFVLVQVTKIFFKKKSLTKTNQGAVVGLAMFYSRAQASK